MLASARVPLKIPGVYAQPDAPAPRYAAQRMDVCAFVGVAPRGPAYLPLVDEHHSADYRQLVEARPCVRSLPVAVNSFDDYRRLFGAFEGPGVLPYALASFFEQGGRRAYVVRIVPRTPPKRGDDPVDLPLCLRGTACVTLTGPCSQPLDFYARNLGRWGNSLQVNLGFTTRTLSFRLGASNSLWLSAAAPALVNSLLRLRSAEGLLQLVYCTGQQEVPDPTRPSSQWELLLASPPAFAPVAVEVVEARLSLADGSGQSEVFDHLALHPDHPNSLVNVLCTQSQLAWPGYTWAATALTPSNPQVELVQSQIQLKVEGLDAYEQLIPDDFFDANWSPGETTPGSGIAALAQLSDLTHLLVPDLYVPAQWARQPPVVEAVLEEAGAEFAQCVRSIAKSSIELTAPSQLTGLILDPRRSDQLQDIAALQNHVVAFCESSQNLIALIDVPPGLSQGQAETWRGLFDSSWCAAYHTWLVASRRVFSQDAQRVDTLRPIPPSAVAAGIIARKELNFGIQYGPANERAQEIVDLAEQIPQARIEAFFPLGMNAFVRSTDGIHLVAARTLSRDSQWRQLSVRRLILMLRRTLLQESQWAVFEPNGPKLWSDLRHALEGLLRGLFRAGAFAGATEAESFFVRLRTEEPLLTRGELIVEIGVAPAEPIEFILIQLRRSGDGTLTLET